MIDAVHSVGGGLVVADLSTLAEGVRTAADGADLIGTTLSGHTPPARPAPNPTWRWSPPCAPTSRTP